MNTDKVTKLRLIEAARREFIEKGYSKASLRSICADAEVTTGALYFFFKDKDDLFEEVMKEPLGELYSVVKMHFAAEAQTEEWDGDITGDIDAAAKIIRVLFRRRDLFLMLLTKAQGSRLENIKDEFVAFVEEHYKEFALQFQKISGKKFRGNDLVHWVAHNQVDVFLYLLEHCESEADAAMRIPRIVSYLTGGWFALFE